jgi:hypothetical protein
MHILIMPVVDIAGRSHYEGASLSIGILSDLLTAQQGNNLYVNEVGDKMRGALDMNNNKITNVAEPIEDKDVVNKSCMVKIEAKLYDEIKKLNDKIKKLQNETDFRFLHEIKAETHWVYGCILNIGNTTEKFKVIRREIQLPILKELATLMNLPSIKKSQCLMQITPILDDDKYHDDLITEIQKYEIGVQSITVYVNTTRPSTTGWGLHLQAHLLIIILKKEMDVI